jgi:type IX secretion system PorP/SprF family membrane protein
MTSINDNNIEKWLFDYYEGNLSQADREALENYILLNPSLESEMDAWSKAYVENENFEYHNADSLIQKKRKIGWIGWSSAAAILITGITLSFLYFSPKETSIAQYSLNKSDIQADAKFVAESNQGLNSTNHTNDYVNENSDENFMDQSPEVNAAENIIEQNKKDELAANNFENSFNKEANKNFIAPAKSNKAISNDVEPNLEVVPGVIPVKENQDLHTLAVVNANNQNNFSQVKNNNSNGQNHEVFVNNTNANIVETNKSHEELISAIPGNNGQNNLVNEFAHLEPVKATIEKDIILNQALDKLDFESNDGAGTYNSNPTYSETDVNLSNNLKNASRKPSTKFIRDIKRAFNNPSGVTNLRDPNLVIPGYNPIAFNPSLTGGMLKTRIQTSYMNQWTGTSEMQHIANFSVDSYVYAMRGGIGMNLTFRDYGKGMYRNYDASLVYSPKINFGKFLAIEPSIKFNMGAYTLNPNKVQPGGQIEIERGNIYQTFENGETPIGTQKYYYDLGVGLFVNTKWFYAGFSMDNVFRHKENIYSNDLSDPRRAPFRINAVVGTDFESSNKNFTGSPFIVYQHFDNYDEFYFGSNFRVHWGTAGFSVSDKGNISAQAGIQFKKFKMTYQYDWTKSKLMGKKGHSHELMFRFTIKAKRSYAKNLEY